MGRNRINKANLINLVKMTIYFGLTGTVLSYLTFYTGYY